MGRVQSTKETPSQLPPESGYPPLESGDQHVITPQSKPTNLPETTSPAVPSPRPAKNTVSGSSLQESGNHQANSLQETSPSVVPFPPPQKFPATNVPESGIQPRVNKLQVIPPSSIPLPPPPLQFLVSGVPAETIPVAANNPVAQELLLRASSVVKNNTVGRPWSTGIFDCHEHPTNAIITAVCPCVTFGQIAEILDEGSTSCLVSGAFYCALSLVLFNWTIAGRYRRRLREAYNLAEAPSSDWAVHLIYPMCSLCQEYRELKNHKIDLSLGYLANIANLQNLRNQQQDASQNPPPSQSMAR